MHSDENFQDRLAQYINTGSLPKADYLLRGISVKSTFKKNSKYFISNYCRYIKKRPESQAEQDVVEIQPYRGSNPFVLRMTQYLSRWLRNDLAGAFVHGSLATYEEIPYSDFDALVIIKDEVFDESARLANTAYLLNRALRIMFTHDPLQHHGWFVMTERDLQNYEGVPLPVAVFPHMKSLLPDKNLLHLCVNKTRQSSQALFDNLTASIADKLQSAQYPSNLYDLKSLLSQFMLLPAAYIQARDGHGIFKRESFAEAARDFSHREWKVMDEVSSIRRDWAYSVDRFSRVLSVSASFPLRSRLLRISTRNIPSGLREICGERLFKTMLDFTFLMKDKLTSQHYTKKQV